VFSFTCGKHFSSTHTPELQPWYLIWSTFHTDYKVMNAEGLLIPWNLSLGFWSDLHSTQTTRSWMQRAYSYPGTSALISDLIYIPHRLQGHECRGLTHTLELQPWFLTWSIFHTDYKVMSAEGFGKRRLFEIMDDLEARTRPIMVAARYSGESVKGA